MASAQRFTCDTCGREVIAWSDGIPYFINEAGEKEYAYHPDHEGLSKCIGNDMPHLCLGCGHEFNVDSEKPRKDCPECGHKKIRKTYALAGWSCPFCKRGKFNTDPDYFAIS